MERKNCWEFTKCGREAGGENAEKLGICPAAVSSEFNDVNLGKYSGRFCWAVAGTFCEGEVAGTLAHKLKDCLHCEFLKYVNRQEGREFKLIPNIKGSSLKV